MRQTWTILKAIGITYLLATSSLAQVPKLEFEVAAIKPIGPSRPSSPSNPPKPAPGRYHWDDVTVRGLIRRAYDLIDNRQISGPKWIDTEHFEISALAPPETTKEQYRQMLQNLLAERFKLTVHHESTVLRVLHLEVGKNGPLRMKESGTPSEDSIRPGFKSDPDGFPVAPPGWEGAMVHSARGPSGEFLSLWTFRGWTMAALASDLTTQISGPVSDPLLVIDKTGLTAKYDFNLSYENPISPGNGPQVPNHPIVLITDSVEQLGLRLVDARDTFDVVVVDSGNKVPTKN